MAGAKTAVMGNVEGVRDMVQKALPALSLLPALSTLSTLSTLAILPMLPTLTMLPKVSTLPVLPFLQIWRTKAQVIRAEKTARAQVWTDNEKKLARFEEAIHGLIDSGLESASASPSPCVDKDQREQMETGTGENEEEEEWKENEGWDDFIS